MFSSLEQSLERDRREEMRREVAEIRLARRLQAGRSERNAPFRFIRSLVMKTYARPESA